MAFVPLRRIALVIGLAVGGASGVVWGQAGVAPATRPILPAAPAASPATAPILKPGGAPATLPATRPTTKPIAARPGPEPLLSMIDLQLMFEQGKYPDLIKQLQRVLILKGKAAEPYDKWTLLMLKFETNMKLKSQRAAISTLEDARDITDDEKKLNWCKGVELLLKRSKNFQYQPMPMKKEKPAAIDIIDPDSRKVALQALLIDEIAVVKPKVDKALDGQGLAGIAEALEALRGFDILESAAGAGEESKQMVADLRTRGITLIGKSIARMKSNHDLIYKSANEYIMRNVQVPLPDGSYQMIQKMTRRGLHYNDKKELEAIQKNITQLVPNLKGLVQATGGQAREVEDMIVTAEDLKKQATRTLEETYTD